MEKLEAVQKENEDLKEKMKENEKENLKMKEKMENENLKMKKKLKELNLRVKLVEKLVVQTPVPNDEASPPETNGNQVKTSRAGPGTCGVCGKDFQRLDMHQQRTKNPECKNACNVM